MSKHRKTRPAALIPTAPVSLDEKMYWSLADAARATTLCTRTLQTLIKANVIPAIHVGRRVLLDPDAVRRALQKDC